MAKGLKFSTYGSDCWRDGGEAKPVAAGECYALVWKQNGATFPGLPPEPPNPADPFAMGEDVWLVDYFPVAERDVETGRMRCPEQVIGIGGLPAYEAQNGTWTVYLLDTRYQTADGLTACGFNRAVTNAPRRINGYAAVPGLTDFTIGTTLGPSWEIKVGGETTGTPVVVDEMTPPQQVVVTFEARGGTCSEVSRMRAFGDDYGELPVPTRTGYTFVGWFTTTEGGEAVVATSPTDGDRTLIARWENNRYSVRFEAAGGAGEMAAVECFYDVSASLPPCGFTRIDADFVGWAKEGSGSAVFGDGGQVFNLTEVPDGVVCLRAVWAFHDGTVCDVLADDAWSSGSTSATGAVVRQGDVSHADRYTAHLTSEGPGDVWVEMTVTNAMRLVFEWRTSGCLVLSVDGETLATLEGNADWTDDVVMETVREGSHSVRWTFYPAGGEESARGDAWVSNIRLHPGIYVEFDGNGAWEVPSARLLFEGDRFALPEQGPMRRWGCDFLGWEVGVELLQPGAELMARRENIRCTAMWTQGEPLPELSWDDPWEAVWEILSEAADGRLRENVYDIDSYMCFREWALAVLTPDGMAVAGAEAVMQAPYAWVSFALDSERLLARAPANEDLVIERFELCEGYGEWFDFTVRVRDVTIGPWAQSWNLGTVFGVEGACELRSDAFSQHEVAVEVLESEAGMLRFKVGRSYSPGPAFFMRPIVF